MSEELRSRKAKSPADGVAENQESLVEQTKAQMKELQADVNGHISATKEAYAASSATKQMVEKMILGAADKAPSKLIPVIQFLAPLVGHTFAFARVLVSVYAALYEVAVKFGSRLPTDLLMAVFGFTLCFTGGTFPMTIAAYEAFKTCGWLNTKQCIKELVDTYRKVKVEDDLDNLVDADHDGIADVKQMDPETLVRHKTMLWMRVAEPEKMSSAMGSLYTACLAVIATLKVQFAKTVALGNAIGEALIKPVSFLLKNPLVQVIPKDYHHWINTIISVTCKMVAISVAYYVQRVISAFHSGIRGGLMFARSILKFTNRMGYTNIDEEESYLDEAVGWSVAMLGVYFQLSHHFSIMFPFNILLMPVNVCEAIVAWSVY